MRNVFILLVGGLLLVVLSACGGNKVDEATAETFTQRAEEVILLLDEGDYEAVFETFNDEMQAGLPVSELAELGPIIEESGELEEIDKASVEEKDGYYISVSRAKYTEENRVFTITFNADGEVAGLFMK